MTSKQYFKGIRMVYAGIIFGIVFMTGFAVYFRSNGFEMVESGGNANFYILASVFFGVTGIFFSRFLFKKKLKSAAVASGLQKKLSIYQSALILKLASLEAPLFLTIVIYLIMGNSMVLVVTGVLFVVFLTYLPTKAKLVADLDLDGKEEAWVNNPDVELNESAPRL